MTPRLNSLLAVLELSPASFAEHWPVTSGSAQEHIDIDQISKDRRLQVEELAAKLGQTPEELLKRLRDA